MDRVTHVALLQDVIKQQIDVGMWEMQKARNICVASSRLHHITILEGQLALYVGAAKAESIVMNFYMDMNFYMERMEERGGAG